MVVKVKKKTNLMGSDTEITQYIPEGIPLTRDRREKADSLDTELKKMAQKINEEYDKLDDSVRKDKFKKWKWLGNQIDKILQNAKNLERTDIDNHAIWPAIGQYLREELKRGFDARRSGTKKDHYRKCWLLATLPDLDWINSWSGWDAFIDRGEQLVMSNKIVPVLKKKFGPLSIKLKSRDFQKIAKAVTEQIPSGTDSPFDIDAMSDEEIERIIDLLYKKITQQK